jgi:putative oxygen-independent coproporphyrinogen III oxidase
MPLDSAVTAQPAFVESPPLGVYVHVPWCVRRCPYCDFNSHPLGGELPERAYVDALLRDLDQELPDVWGRRPISVFIGGGTPSLLSPESIDGVLSGLRARLALAPGLEVTLEANPGTVEAGRFREFRSAGVTRLSIGIQSFDDSLLQAIGRIHNGAEAACAVGVALSAGFDDLNLDLMYGLPGQDVQGALGDLEQAIALGPTHISHYQLTLEPNTRFHRQPPALPEEDVLWATEQACRDRLSEAGYGRYEVSAYARAGRRCVHNLNYWEFGDYLGIGAGAHGKLTQVSRARVVRRTKHRHPRVYLDSGVALADERTLSGDDLVLEFMLNALRLVDGFSEGLFRARTGLAPGTPGPSLSTAVGRGLLERSEGQIRPTPMGLQFLNDLVALFLPEDEVPVQDEPA